MKFKHFLVLRTLCHMKSSLTRVLTLGKNTCFVVFLSTFQLCSQKCGHSLKEPLCNCVTLWRNHQSPHFLFELGSHLWKACLHCFCTFDVSFPGLILSPVPHMVPTSLSVATCVSDLSHHNSLPHMQFCPFFHYYEEFPSVLWSFGNQSHKLLCVLALTLRETMRLIYFLCKG